MQSGSPVFDAGAYKRTTRAQWQEAADAWHRYAPTLRAWLGAATRRMLDLSRVDRGQNVLDVAAGAGEQTLMVAERVGSEGSVLASDLAPKILEYAAETARAAGFHNVKTAVLDGEELDVPAASFDVVLSRLGLIYFPDRAKAMSAAVRALKPGGRVAAIVYSTAENNRFFSLPVSIIRRRAGLGAPLPGQPGPFSLGSPEALRELFEAAGCSNVLIERHDAPLRLPSADACVRFERESFGALHQMLSGLDDTARTEAWVEIAAALREFETPDGFVGPCELLIAVGTKPSHAD